MPARPLLMLALGAMASTSALTPAAAGSCCNACGVPCPVPAPVLVVPEPVYVKPIYIVNQGPVYGGPGIVTRPLKKHFNVPLADYPYVGHDFYYPAYNPYIGRGFKYPPYYPYESLTYSYGRHR